MQQAALHLMAPRTAHRQRQRQQRQQLQWDSMAAQAGRQVLEETPQLPWLSRFLLRLMLLLLQDAPE